MPTTPRRALIVIDVQNEYIDGDLRIDYPPIDTSLINIGRAMDAATAASIPVVLVQNDAAADSPLFAVGSRGWQLHPAVAKRPHAHLVNKALPSAFAGTDLAQWLTSHEIDTITVVGYMTQNCDAATIYEAAHRGFAAERAIPIQQGGIWRIS